MTDLIRPLLAGFETADFNMRLQLGDLENTDAVRRARGDAGSSISWIVGHLLDYRCRALQGCGVKVANPYAETFSFQKPASDGSDYPDIAELREGWEAIHGKLSEALSNMSEDQLLAPSQMPNPHGGQSLLDALSFCMWHEGYHVGAIGMLRVQWGRKHTHVLAMEAMGIPTGGVE